MIRFGHGAKTFGNGWRLRQPVPGVHLGRTRPGYWFRVHNDGATPWDGTRTLSVHDPPPPHSATEEHLVTLLRTG
jgi:hypothetical protein